MSRLKNFFLGSMMLSLIVFLFKHFFLIAWNALFFTPSYFVAHFWNNMNRTSIDDFISNLLCSFLTISKQNFFFQHSYIIFRSIDAFDFVTSDFILWFCFIFSKSISKLSVFFFLILSIIISQQKFNNETSWYTLAVFNDNFFMHKYQNLMASRWQWIFFINECRLEKIFNGRIIKFQEIQNKWTINRIIKFHLIAV